MRVFTIANHKGGSGKTTVAVNLAHALSLRGRRCLLVDLDAQGNAGVGLGLPVHESPKTVFGLMTEPHARLSDYTQSARPNLDIVVSNLDSATLETELLNRLNRERILATTLRAHAASSNAYDVIVIDTPPSLGLLTVNAMVAATEMIVVVDCGFYALYGLKRLLETVELVRDGFDKGDLQVRAVVNNFDVRQNLDRDVMAEVQRTFGSRMYATVVRRNVKLKEAQSAGRPVIEYAPSSAGAADFAALARDLEKGGARGRRTKKAQG